MWIFWEILVWLWKGVPLGFPYNTATFLSNYLNFKIISIFWFYESVIVKIIGCRKIWLQLVKMECYWKEFRIDLFYFDLRQIIVFIDMCRLIALHYNKTCNYVYIDVCFYMMPLQFRVAPTTKNARIRAVISRAETNSIEFARKKCSILQLETVIAKRV